MTCAAPLEIAEAPELDAECGHAPGLAHLDGSRRPVALRGRAIRHGCPSHYTADVIERGAATALPENDPHHALDGHMRFAEHDGKSRACILLDPGGEVLALFVELSCIGPSTGQRANA